MVLEEYIKKIREDIAKRLEEEIDKAKSVDDVFKLLMSLTEAKTRDFITKDAFLMLDEKLKKKFKEIVGE